MESMKACIEKIFISQHQATKKYKKYWLYFNSTLPLQQIDHSFGQIKEFIFRINGIFPYESKMFVYSNISSWLEISNNIFSFDDIRQEVLHAFEAKKWSAFLKFCCERFIIKITLSRTAHFVRGKLPWGEGAVKNLWCFLLSDGRKHSVTAVCRIASG